MKLNKLLLLLILFLASCSRLDIKTTQGEKFSSNSFKENIVVLNIWADWCPPCIVEMPYFNKLDEDPNIIVLGFHFDQFDVLDSDELNRMIKKFNMKFHNIENDPREIWGIDIPENVPTTYIIKENQIVSTLIKPQTYESLVKATEI